MWLPLNVHNFGYRAAAELIPKTEKIATVVDLIREIGQKKEQYRKNKKLKEAGKHPTSSKVTNPFFKGLLPTIVKNKKEVC